MALDEGKALTRPRWWSYVAALLVFAFMYGETSSLPLALGLGVLALLVAFALTWAKTPPREQVLYCRQCGETLDRNARQGCHCGSASWSVHE